MPSTDCGKPEAIAWIRANFKSNATVLDVGACDGKWKRLLPEFNNMDAVEAFEPNVRNNDLPSLYRNVFNADIRGFKYKHYDLIIFGDVLEHLSVSEAQNVVEYAKSRCTDMVIGVPFRYPQGAIYGNPYEEHKQDDLTMSIFNERYKGFKVLYTTKDYCYYTKEKKDASN